MTHVDLTIGPANSGKSALILRDYSDHVRSFGSESSLLILPSHRRIRESKYRLLTEFGMPALVDAQIMTFPDLADRLLAENGQKVRQISLAAQRILVRRIVEQMAAERALAHFAPVKDYPGFLTALLELFSELKRGAVEPLELERIADRGEFAEPRTRELATLYSRYQERLNALDLFDAEGRFWWARNLLDEGHFKPFAGLRYMFVDGFSDWTPTQWNVLQRLVERCEEAKLALTHENAENSMRPDLFIPTERTLKQFEAKFQLNSIQYVGSDSGDKSHLAHVERWLFVPVARRDSPREGAASLPASPSIQVLSAPGKSREVEAIARKVKRILMEGVAPNHIGLVFRQLEAYGEIVRRIFEGYGIPCHVTHSPLLRDQPLTRTLFALLEIPTSDYQREKVVQFANSNYACLDSVLPQGLTPGDLDTATREAAVTSGRENWRVRLEALHARVESSRQRELGEEEDNHHRFRSSPTTITASLQFLENLSGIFGSIPPQAYLAEYLEHVGELMPLLRIHLSGDSDQLSVISQLSETGEPWCAELDGSDAAGPLPLTVLSSDLQTWQLLVEQLQELRRLTGEFEEFNPQLDYVSFVELLQALLGQVRLPEEPWMEGRVSVLDAYQAREVSFDYLFLGGLVEKEFPQVTRESAFYSDRERSRLKDLGVNLEERLPVQREEAYLFYLALTRARKKVFLSYPTTDSAGHKLIPSYYLQTVEKCLTGVTSIAHDQERLSQVTREISEVSCTRELAERVFHQFWSPRNRLADSPQDLESAYNFLTMRDQSRLSHLLHGVDVQQRRYSRKAFDLFDGMLRDKQDIRDHLLVRKCGKFSEFGVDARFSASQLGTYGSCPFKYFASKVLSLEPPLDPSEFVEPRERGSVYHEVARRFLEQLPKRTGAATVTEATLARAESLMDEAVDGCFRRVMSNPQASSTALWEIERELCRAVMHQFLHKEMKLHDHEPREFEYEYGGDARSQPLAVTFDDKTVLLQGKIDRVDWVGDGGFVVYDYKTGQAPSKRRIHEGSDLQLPIYAMAAQEFLFGDRSRTCVEWAYYLLKRGSGFSGIAKSGGEEDSIEDLLEVARKHIIGHVEHIQEGRFQVEPKRGACRNCELKSLCRVEHWRIRDKASERGDRNA